MSTKAIKGDADRMMETECGNCGAEMERKAKHIQADRVLGRDWFCTECGN